MNPKSSWARQTINQFLPSLPFIHCVTEHIFLTIMILKQQEESNNTGDQKQKIPETHFR